MTHPRKTIRDRATTLLTGLTTTTTNVFPSRVYPVESTKLPCLLVYVGPEEADIEADSMGRVKIINAELLIEVRAAKSSDIDDQLDLILEEVQAAIATNRNLTNALKRNAMYLGIEGPEWSAEGEIEHASMTIQYTVTYEVTL